MLASVCGVSLSKRQTCSCNEGVSLEGGILCATFIVLAIETHCHDGKFSFLSRMASAHRFYASERKQFSAHMTIQHPPVGLIMVQVPSYIQFLQAGYSAKLGRDM